MARHTFGQANDRHVALGGLALSDTDMNIRRNLSIPI